MSDKPWLNEDGTVDGDKIPYDKLNIVKVKDRVSTPPKQLEIAQMAYDEDRYAFGNTGWLNAGTFHHTILYGVFYLTDDELKEWNNV